MADISEARWTGRLTDDRVLGRVNQLLEDARLARQAGDAGLLRALASAVLALDPDNAKAEDLLVGAARRRQMTLMFCDIVGSTAIADARDPEETGELLAAYREACAAVIESHRGFLDENQGDGLLVRFGYPEVHEDDALRAVRCGLEIAGAVADRTQRLQQGGLHVRVAVHTDLVVLDKVGVSGATASEAARIQSLAQPDTVVISDATEALVRGWFDVASLGTTVLRGVTRPVELFTVVRERRVGRRETGTTPSPFAGRRAERERITHLWGRTCAQREGSVEGGTSSPVPGLLITGPAGIGKTRLVGEAAGEVGAAWVECRCSRYHENTSVYAFRPLLEQVCLIDERDGPVQRLAKLRARLGADLEHGGDLPFLAAALQIPASALTPPREVDPRMLRERALAAAVTLVQSICSDRPCLLFVDDLHWADQSTLDLISALLAAPRSGLLVVLAARDGFQSPWPEPVIQRLRLEPLDEPELQAMTARMPEGARLSEHQRSELIARSDGIPLFLEELVRTADAVDSGQVLHRSLRYADYHVPVALQDSLMARLASPEVDLDLAQMAATIGRDVDRTMLREVADVSEAQLQSRLRTLVSTGLVDAVGEHAIRFRHELIREVAYETQRRSVLRARHSRIADHLLAHTSGTLLDDSGQAAFHLEGAHRYDEAVAVHLRAAQADQAIGAHAEATRRLTGTLALLEQLPAGAHREQTELMVRELRSFSAVMAGGYAAPEAAEDHPRCVELCERLGLRPEMLPSLIRSWSYYAFRGRLADADHVSDRMEQARSSGVLSFPVAEVGRGIIGFFQGRFPEARRTMAAFVDHPWARTTDRPPQEWPLPNDPLASICAHLVPVLWIGGEPAAADAMGERALHRAAGLDFPYGPFSLGYVKSLLAFTQRLRGDHRAAGQLAEELVELGERHGFRFWGLVGSIQGYLTAVHEGDLSSLGSLADSVATWRFLLVADVWTPYWLTELAVAQRLAGQPSDALASLDDALAVASATGSEFYSAETLRVRGEVRRELGDPGAGTDLEDARKLARRQGAAVFETRAVASLGAVVAR